MPIGASDHSSIKFDLIISSQYPTASLPIMGAGTGGAGWASAHSGKNQSGNGPPWKF